MKNLSQNVLEIVQAPRTGVVVGAGTFATGLAKWMEYIPNDIGKLTTLIGALVAIGMFAYHIRKDRRDTRKADIEYEIMKEELKKLREDDA